MSQFRWQMMEEELMCEYKVKIIRTPHVVEFFFNNYVSIGIRTLNYDIRKALGQDRQHFIHQTT